MRAAQTVLRHLTNRVLCRLPVLEYGQTDQRALFAGGGPTEVDGRPRLGCFSRSSSLIFRKTTVAFGDRGWHERLRMSGRTRAVPSSFIKRRRRDVLALSFHPGNTLVKQQMHCRQTQCCKTMPLAIYLLCASKDTLPTFDQAYRPRLLWHYNPESL